MPAARAPSGESRPGRPTPPRWSRRSAPAVPLTAAFYDWGGGLIWLLVGEQGDAGAAPIRAATRRLGGHATLIRAAAATRAAVDVFEPEPGPLARISAGLRARFDPAGILNPGRMRA